MKNVSDLFPSICYCYIKTLKIQSFNINHWSSDKLLLALVSTDYYYHSYKLKLKFLNLFWLFSNYRCKSVSHCAKSISVQSIYPALWKPLILST